MQKFIQIMRYKGVIEVNNEIFDQYGISKLIITSWSAPTKEGYKAQQDYSFEAVGIQPDREIEVTQDTINIINQEMVNTESQDMTWSKLLQRKLDNLKDLSRLAGEYKTFTEIGVKIYVTYACIDIDQVPENERGNLDLMGELFTARFSEMDGVTVFGDIRDFVYHDADFYDTVYHLLTAPAKRCTAVWLKDLSAQLQKDGLWGETP